MITKRGHVVVVRRKGADGKVKIEWFASMDEPLQIKHLPTVAQINREVAEKRDEALRKLEAPDGGAN